MREDKGFDFTEVSGNVTSGVSEAKLGLGAWGKVERVRTSQKSGMTTRRQQRPNWSWPP